MSSSVCAKFSRSHCAVLCTKPAFRSSFINTSATHDQHIHLCSICTDDQHHQLTHTHSTSCHPSLQAEDLYNFFLQGIGMLFKPFIGSESEVLFGIFRQSVLSLEECLNIALMSIVQITAMLQLCGACVVQSCGPDGGGCGAALCDVGSVLVSFASPRPLPSSPRYPLRCSNTFLATGSQPYTQNRKRLV